MGSKKNKDPGLSFTEAVRLIREAGLNGQLLLTRSVHAELAPLPERVGQILGLYQQNSTKPGSMIFFIMYDIQNNRVRNQVAKYLLKKGCLRIQKSVFLAHLERPLFEEIGQTLKEVQEVYDNEDSILITPVSGDELKAMRVIGQQMDLDVVLDKRSTIFF